MAATASRNARRRSWRIAFTVCAGAALALTSCVSRKIDVSTTLAPNATLAGRTSFRILPAAAYNGTIPLAPNDPMLAASSTAEAIRDEIRRAFERGGYRYSPESADFDVAYYATTARLLDLNVFDYGYSVLRFPEQFTRVVTYPPGTVIIDVVDPATHALLWRGQATVAPLSGNMSRYIADLRKAVDAIIAKFPKRSS